MSLSPDLFSLKGRVALITGGSKGLGKMIAAGFLVQGAKVYIAARNRADCEDTARELSINGRTCIAIPADLSTLPGIEALVREVKAREPALDILVNNAGTAARSKLAEFSEEAWDSVMTLNVKSPFFLTKNLIDLLRAAALQRPAKVINISSIDGVRLNAGDTYSYSASKAALIHLTAHLASRLIGDGIVVSTIAPGAFASDMNVSARDYGDLLAKRVPAKRIGRPEDIAGAAIFLASSAGDYVVGATLEIDGGFARALPTHGHPLN